MIINKPPKENKTFLCNEKINNYNQIFVLARQALYLYLINCSEEFVLVPRYLASGVYLPLLKANKKSIYYDLKDNFEIDFSSFDITNFNKNNMIFYYIHHFGLYTKSNIDYLHHLKNNGYHIIDDRSLSLPSKNYLEFANATLYSLYKLIGIPYGSLIILDKDITLVTNNSSGSYKIQNLMKKNLNFYSAFYIKLLPSFLFRVANKIYGRKVNFNPIVESDWFTNNFISDSEIINFIDFDAINKKRKLIAKMYLDKLNPNLILSSDSIKFTYQSLIGFPIYTEHPVKNNKLLINKGINSFILKKGWWFDAAEKQWKIVNHHILLPAHHYLNKKDIDKICNTVNHYL